MEVKKNATLKIVIWNAEKGFGFALYDSRRVYIHWSAIESKTQKGEDLTGREICDFEINWNTSPNPSLKKGWLTKKNLNGWLEIRPIAWRRDRFAQDGKTGALLRLPYEIVSPEGHLWDSTNYAKDAERGLDPIVYCAIARSVPIRWGVCEWNSGGWIERVTDEDDNLESLQDRHPGLPLVDNKRHITISGHVEGHGVDLWNAGNEFFDSIKPSTEEVGQTIYIDGWYVNVADWKYASQAVFQVDFTRSNELPKWFDHNNPLHIEIMREAVSAVLKNKPFFKDLVITYVINKSGMGARWGNLTVLQEDWLVVDEYGISLLEISCKMDTSLNTQMCKLWEQNLATAMEKDPDKLPWEVADAVADAINGNTYSAFYHLRHLCAMEAVVGNKKLLAVPFTFSSNAGQDQEAWFVQIGHAYGVGSNPKEAFYLARGINGNIPLDFLDGNLALALAENGHKEVKVGSVSFVSSQWLYL